MTNGTSQGLFIVVAIVIFGIFVGLSQTLFGKQLTNDLVAIFEQSTEQNTFDKNKDYNVEDVVPNDESDFIFDDVNKIIGYKGSSTEVVIPKTINNKTVTSISGDAFNNKGITKIIMPNSLTTIEDGKLEGSNIIGAFANNTIEEISFSANLKYIGSFAFFSGELDDVILPEGLKSIGEGSFEQDNLSKISIPSTVENIGDNAFKDNNITEVNYASGSLLKNIGSNIFSGNNIDSLKLPSGISNIKENAYSNSGLKNVTIPKGTQVIGKDAFSNNDLTSVEIPNGVTEIHENAFSNNQLTNVSIPASVEKIGKNSFSNNKLSEVTIPENVKEIEEGSFKENELTNVDLQEGLESIGDYAFYKNQLPVIELPSSLLNIGKYAFYSNKLSFLEIPNKVSVIREWSFAYNQLTSKPTIPSNVVTEEENAFYGNLFDARVTFEDDNLAMAVAKKLGVPIESITTKLMQSITTLELSNADVSNLTGLEYATNITTLNITGNPNLVDVTPLNDLGNLKKLVITREHNISEESLSKLILKTGVKIEFPDDPFKITGAAGTGIFYNSTGNTKVTSNPRIYYKSSGNKYTIRAKFPSGNSGYLSRYSTNLSKLSLNDADGIAKVYKYNNKDGYVEIGSYTDAPQTVTINTTASLTLTSSGSVLNDIDDYRIEDVNGNIYDFNVSIHVTTYSGIEYGYQYF